MAIGLKIKHSTGEITTGTGNLTLNASGNLILDYATFPSADGTSGQILKTDGAGNLSWAADSGGPADTDALPEGSSNLYYTDARADARAQLKIDAIIDSAPGALDTLNELAASLGDDANFAGTMTTALGGKEPTVAAGTTAQYYKGNKSWATLDTAAVTENTNLYYTDAKVNTHLVSGNVEKITTPVMMSQNAHLKIGSEHTNDLNIFLNNTETLQITRSGTEVRYQSNGGTGAHRFMNDVFGNGDIDIATGKVYKINGSQITTDSINEGSSNLYYTDARADARITPAAVSDEANTSTGAFIVPTGTTAQRPGTPAVGMMRFNTTTVRFEGYNGSAWVPIDTLYS